MSDLGALLAQLDADAPLAQRHLALIALLRWLRGPRRSHAEAAAGRVRLLLDALDAQPAQHERFRRWWRELAGTVDTTALLADFGLAARLAFLSEFSERLRQKLLPATPETYDAAELFALALPTGNDAAWVAALDARTLERLARLLTLPSPLPALTLWQHEVLQAIDFCASQVRAAGLSAELRQRMRPAEAGPSGDSAALRQAQPFHALAQASDEFRAAWLETPREPLRVDAAAARLREALDACRQSANGVYPHLAERGISVGLVFQLRQLRERVLRIRELMDCLLAAEPQGATARLVGRLAVLGQERRSLRALVAANSSLLAARVTERSAETGEQYITRTPAEYRDMLAKAAGGGMITAGTVILKFLLGKLGLAAFWGGVWSGVLYAASFVAIHLMHWTLATKQPAMTAPAMAARLRDLSSADRVEEFVDEVAHLVRSQVAAVVGNVGLVVPSVALLALAFQGATGQPVIGRAEAEYVIQSLHLLSPTTLLFAAFTGTLLFASSLIAGWVENWFVLHRLDSALRYNPRISAVLGTERAARRARFMRDNVSGFAASISLGLLLGLVPPVLGFLGLGLQTRHVTLSAGQLTAAAVALMPADWHLPQAWAGIGSQLAWCAAAIPLIGMLNLVVSFYLAFRLALRAHSVSGVDRRRIRLAILARCRRRPGSFLLPA